MFLLSEIAPGVPNLGSSKGDKRAAPGEENRLVFTTLPLGFGNISSGLVRFSQSDSREKTKFCTP